MEEARQPGLAGFSFVFFRRGLPVFILAGLVTLAAVEAVAAALEPVAVRAEHQAVPEGTGLERSGLTVEAAFVLRSRHAAFGGLYAEINALNHVSFSLNVSKLYVPF